MNDTLYPTILVPGVEATTLMNVNSIDFASVWSQYDSILTSIGKPNLTYKLQINPLFDEDFMTIIDRGHLARLPYSDIITSIESYQNLNASVFLFGYDWRKSNIENGHRLLHFVNYLREKLNINKFNFLTHSMGGLVFSCFLSLLKTGNDYIENDYDVINKVAMTVCPFRGSVYALVHVALGNAGIHSIFNSNDLNRKANRTFPSLYELCPFYENAVISDQTKQEVDLLKIDNWQSNLFDDIAQLAEARLELLSQFRNNYQAKMDQLPATVRSRIVSIIGQGGDTHNQVLVEPKAESSGNPVTNFFNFDVPEGDGDGTVPIQSSSFYAKSIFTLSINKSNWILSNLASFHGLFLKDARVQNIVNRFFYGDSSSENWWLSIGSNTVNIVSDPINLPKL